MPRPFIGMPVCESGRAAPAAAIDPEVEVAVLGPVEIRGAVRPFGRVAAKELVVYLAFHRQGVRNDVWASALWTDRSIVPSTLHSTASVARRALGQAKNGADHLPRGGRRLRLADTVRTDVDRFAGVVANPDPVGWKEALALVRGRPFEGLNLADWAVLDGTQAQLESLLVDTALRAAEHFLRRGLGEDAEWAIRRGLRASPYDERLYRALLWAAEVMGNRVGMRSAMAELLCLAAGGGTPGWGASPGTGSHAVPSFVHPRTAALFRQLSRGELPAARGDPYRL
jgi:DNA-binding SARP family transcriptional activator